MVRHTPDSKILFPTKELTIVDLPADGSPTNPTKSSPGIVRQDRGAQKTLTKRDTGEMHGGGGGGGVTHIRKALEKGYPMAKV